MARHTVKFVAYWIALYSVLLLAVTEGGRPNFVLFMADSFDGRLTFYPGNVTLQLPFINYMREHGTIFLNSYTNSPICCPSRAAMWSGKFIHMTESWNNFKCLDDKYTTWMDILQEKGYVTKQFGKVDYKSGGHSLSNRVEAWTREVKFLIRQEGRPTVNLTGDASTVRVMKEDWNTTEKAAQWIRTTASILSDPFSLYIGVNLPHPYKTTNLGENAGSSTFQTSPFWLNKISVQNITVPKWLPFSKMHQVDYYSTYTKNCTAHFSDKEITNIRAYYYAMCVETDAMLGEILSALYDTNLLNETILIFTSDHGELALEHQQFYKMSMYEGSSHIPFLIMGPNVKAGQQISNPVSLVDVYPTVLDIAEIACPCNLSGYSLLPFLTREYQARSNLHPEWVLSEFHGSDANASTYMIRTSSWKLIAYADGSSVPSQLFDLSNDKEELYNVAAVHPRITESLERLLLSIVDYPAVSKAVQMYNRQQFKLWKLSLGRNYSEVIANLRWHVDWKQNPKMYEDAIEKWLNTDV
ncbi:arylsulfatase K [Erpetoichthys calabaricus]|uniref:Arylsulfatase K n=1 Tax=Erpetoichthys calabaricus TaxID=27687 RepID=A0A8C4S4P3_ERPCA|nr:arylsulfatase K [Erpetoichthys calabaricus]